MKNVKKEKKNHALKDQDIINSKVIILEVDNFKEDYRGIWRILEWRGNVRQKRGGGGTIIVMADDFSSVEYQWNNINGSDSSG